MGLISRLKASWQKGGLHSVWATAREAETSSTTSSKSDVVITTKCLRDVLPYTFESDVLIPADANADQLNAAFEALSKDPLWLYTAVDKLPLGQLKFKAFKQLDEAMLDYANLDTNKGSDMPGAGSSEEEDADYPQLDEEEALLAFASLEISQ